MTFDAHQAPLLDSKRYDRPSVFTAVSLLREARRQAGLPERRVPAVCVLDPDGDTARVLRDAGRSQPDGAWACFHTRLDRFRLGGREAGIVPSAVGGPFAVLVAEELFASGCRLLLSVTSAGRLAARPGSTAFVLIDRALRDEGTSYHYLPAARWSRLAPSLADRLGDLDAAVTVGATWTTDAPFRETAEDVERHTAAGVLGVEMEAAALYAFAQARRRPVVCFAHLTNELGRDGDFEKGPEQGAEAMLSLLAAAVGRLSDVLDEAPGRLPR